MGHAIHPGIVLIWGALVLQGCTTLGPDFTEPEVEWLAAWQPDLYGQIQDPGELTRSDLRFWWRAFDDPVLNRLIETAERENLSLRVAGLRIEIAEENAAIQKRSYEITERVYRSGEQSELDLQQAKTQYLATLATIPDLQRSLVQTRNALAALPGRPPGDLPELVGKAGKLPPPKPVLVKDIPARLLLRRPEARDANRGDAARGDPPHHAGAHGLGHPARRIHFPERSPAP